MSDPLKVLIVEDSEDDAFLLIRHIKNAGFNTIAKRVETVNEFQTALNESTWDIVLSDYSLPGFNGLQALQLLKKHDPLLPFIIVSGAIGEEVAVELMKNGARDYVMKNNMHRLIPAIRRELVEMQERRQNMVVLERLKELQFIVNHSPGICFSWRAEPGWPVDFVSENISQFGFSVDDFLTEKLRYADVLHKDDLPRIQREVDHYVAEGRTEFSQEYRIVTKSGEVRWLDDRTWIRRNDQGVVTHFQGIIMDITALRASEQRYRDLFEAANDAILIFEPEQEIILEANTRACELYGFEKAELVGKSLKYLTKHIERGQKQIEELLQSGVCKNYETVHFHRSGSEIIVLVNSSVIVFEGQKAIVSINRDITELRLAEMKRDQLEEQLRQFQKMEAIGQLAGGVSHDFNNILMAITGYCELLLQRIADDCRRDILEVMKAAEKGASLTRQLLAFSRKQVLQPKILNLNMLLQEMTDMIRRLLGEDIELVTFYVDNLGSVQADPGQMQQVILNLAANARDAMPRGGKLCLRTANIDLPPNHSIPLPDLPPGPYVTVTVSDTGVGMDENTLKHIFEPFYTTKERDKGTGLGLATVYGILKQSSGHIYVESEVGQGTEMHLFLPRVNAKPEDIRSVIPRKAAAGANELILLVDDNEMIRKPLAEILRLNGYQVFDAADGAAALDIARTFDRPVDVLVTDVVMPQISGMELEQHMRVLFPNLKVLFMSGYSEEAVHRYGVMEPGRAFVQKPAAASTLLLKIGDLLRQQNPLFLGVKE